AADGLRKGIREMISAQLASLAPKDTTTLRKFRETVGPALPPLFGVGWRKGKEHDKTTIVVCTRPEEAEPYAKGASGGVEVVVLKPHDRETHAGGDPNQLKAYPTC